MGSALTRPCSPVFNAPDDVLRCILEIAAYDDIHTACLIVRVCKLFQSWIEPIIYKTVVLSYMSHVSAFKFTMARRGTSLQTHVKNLVIRLPASLDAQLLTQLCIALESVYIDISQVHRLHDIHDYPSTSRQLTICGPLAQVPTRSLPVFASITHLLFLGDIPRDLDDDHANFPNLTHFACRYRVANGLASSDSEVTSNQLAAMLQRVIRLVLRCAKLQVFIIIVQDDAALVCPSEDQIRSMILPGIAQYFDDSRIIFVGVAPNDSGTECLLEHWDLHHGRMWNEAHKEVERRQESKHLYSRL